MADNDGENSITMVDVLQKQQEFEEDANAVLGASDDKNCTYSKGYIKRQALYACLTCCVETKDDPTKRAGVCLACSLHCHENHELIELYTKRNFRCDCGNRNFNGHPCQFSPNKLELNEENEYNQNFGGLYCICHRPYPDPDVTYDDEMIQCIICEDWLHTAHLEATVPQNDQYAEMICKSCMDKNEFLHDYSDIAVTTDVDVDVTVSADFNATAYSCNGTLDHANDNPIGAQDTSMETESSKEQLNIEQQSSSVSVQAVESVNTECIDGNNDTTEKPTSPISTDKVIEIQKAVDSETEFGRVEKDDTNIEKKQEDVANTIDNSETTDQQATQDEVTSNECKDTKVDAIETLNNDNTISNDDQQQNSELNKDNVEKKSLEEINSPPENNKPTDDGEIEDTLESATKELSELTNKLDDELKKDEQSTEPNDINKMETANLESSNDIENALENGDVNGKLTAEEESPNEQKRKIEEDSEEKAVKKAKLDISGCVRPKGVSKIHNGATFWPNNFREKLCTCNECLTMYKDLRVLFLIDLEDTVTAYEAKGQERIDGEPTTQYEQGLQALSSLSRVQQINAITEYNRMKEKLIDLLTSIKNRGEIVKEEDIRSFFAGMKPRQEPDGVYFCR